MPTVLVFTCAELGQANVNLATSYELALAGVDVCIASFLPLKPRVSYLQELVERHRDTTSSERRPTGSITFRECKGITAYSEISKKIGLDCRHPHGVFGALQSYKILALSFLPWSPQEHLATIESTKEIILDVKPDVVMIDKLFYDARDACRLLGQKFIIMHPTSLKDAAAPMQPFHTAFWKYPVVSSGFPFPIKWWQIPLNAYLYIRLILSMIFSDKLKQNRLMRDSLGIKALSPFAYCPGVTHICPGLPEIDFPLTVIPEAIVPCGPIVMPFDPVEESDPALKKWLDNGPTVLINLGSHMTSDQKLAREMASAFRILLDYHDRKGARIQVLWKAKASEGAQVVINNIVGKEVKEGRVKVVAWLDAEPVSILQHPNLVCTVHHGGANSFYEGVWSGLPHIVLPVWYDTYSYATRAEYLNIGIFGSKTSAPGVRADELGSALVRVTGDTLEGRKFRATAKHLKEVCRAKGNGRKLACIAVLKDIGVTKLPSALV